MQNLAKRAPMLLLKIKNDGFVKVQFTTECTEDTEITICNDCILISSEMMKIGLFFTRMF